MTLIAWSSYPWLLGTKVIAVLALLAPQLGPSAVTLGLSPLLWINLLLDYAQAWDSLKECLPIKPIPQSLRAREASNCQLFPSVSPLLTEPKVSSRLPNM